MYKSNYHYLARTTAKISHGFRCYFAVGGPKGEDSRGDAGTPRLFFRCIYQRYQRALFDSARRPRGGLGRPGSAIEPAGASEAKGLSVGVTISIPDDEQA
jgi:hypothetical protein